jgi:quercetin dioxygenase-like cupin family protein
MPFHLLHATRDTPPIRIPEIGLELRILVPPAATGGVLATIETTNAPGFGPPLHRHPETEIFHVLEGRYRFEVDGQRLIAGPGDAVVVPGGAAHGFVNITGAPARQLVQILPAMDAAGFFQGLGAVMREHGLNREALAAFGAAWRVEFLGPPLEAGER